MQSSFKSHSLRQGLEWHRCLSVAEKNGWSKTAARELRKIMANVMEQHPDANSIKLIRGRDKYHGEYEDLPTPFTYRWYRLTFISAIDGRSR